MTRRDLERFVRDRTGVVTPGERDRRLDAIVRYRETDDGLPVVAPPPFVAPGFFAADITSSTSLPTNRTVARYLGQAPYDLSSVTVRVNVTTAVSGTTWAEVAVATSADTFIIGAAADLRTEGWVNVSSDFNSIGTKDTEIGVAIGRGAHVWALFGSQATTPYQLRAGIGEGVQTGLTQFSDATRPSTMADPTTFGMTTGAASSIWVVCQW